MSRSTPSTAARIQLKGTEESLVPSDAVVRPEVEAVSAEKPPKPKTVSSQREIAFGPSKTRVGRTVRSTAYRMHLPAAAHFRSLMRSSPKIQG